MFSEVSVSHFVHRDVPLHPLDGDPLEGPWDQMGSDIIHPSGKNMGPDRK